MKTFLTLFFIFSFLNVQSQEKDNAGYNLSFENISPSANFPQGWLKWGTKDYARSIDSAVKSDGKYSMRIDAPDKKETESFGSIGYGIPVKFTGKKVIMRGKMKLENVSGGFAGLLLRIDGKDEALQFDNMARKNISGTSDWTEYSIELPLDESARTIYIGGLLTGTGKIWLDDFSLLIDEKEISTLQLTEPVFAKGELDREFEGNSRISIENLSDIQKENLFILGRVWGFLKYYHPAVAKGDYNWDYELFRVTPKILTAVSADERNSVLLQWISSLGEITEFKENESASFVNAKLTPDLEWLKDKNTFGEELTAKFESVRTSKKTEESYYIDMFEGVGNPKFRNENTYEDYFKNAVPDDGYRLLALFRYWNMIQYFFPDKHLIGEDWNNVLKEFTPLFVNQKSDLDYRLNTLKLIARIHDTHANIWSSEKLIENYIGTRTAPLEITFIEEKPVVTEYLAGLYDSKAGMNSGLKIGDEIISINGKSSADIIKERQPFTCASNYPTQLREIAMNFFRTNDSLITVKIMRDGKEETKKVICSPLYSINYKDYWDKKVKLNTPAWKFLNKETGYLNPAALKNDSLEFIMNKFKDTKGIVIDFRCYPADFLVFTLGKYLLPEPKDFVKFTNGSLDYPGLFTFTENLKTGETNKDYYKGKVIIIVDESTQSSAEYQTMALRTAPNAKVIGSTTAGADGNVSEIYLPGGIRTMISGIGILTPDGKETQRVGIIPDIEIKPTIKGFKEGKDELLLRAIEMVEK